MTLKESMVYITARASASGYTEAMIEAFREEVEYLLYQLDDWSAEDLDGVFEEVF